MLGGLVKNLAMVGKLRFSDKDITFDGERLAFYFIPQLVEEYMAQKKINGLDYCVASFLASRWNGKNFVKRHGIPMQKDFEHVIKLSSDILGAFGWGRFKVMKVDAKNKFLMVLAETSNLAEGIKSAYGSQKDPVDQMLAGLFAGAAEAYLNTPLYTVELNCAVQKDVKTCTFITASKDRILTHVKKLDKGSLTYAEKFLNRVYELEEKK